MGDPELLSMLAAEAERRGPTIITGIEQLAASGERDSGRIEELRVEAHGLKGAALVVGQERLADLARLIEQFLADCVDAGSINPANAAAVVTAASAFTEGAQAAAEGVGEPSSVGDSLEILVRGRPEA
jgi:chemotaxis protein histidine kinase CheA